MKINDSSEMKEKYVFSRFWKKTSDHRRTGSPVRVDNGGFLTYRFSRDISEMSLGCAPWKPPEQSFPLGATGGYYRLLLVELVLAEIPYKNE